MENKGTIILHFFVFGFVYLGFGHSFSHSRVREGQVGVEGGLPGRTTQVEVPVQEGRDKMELLE